MTAHLALAGESAGVIAPRSQMGFSLGWHIILACLGVGLPGLTLFFEWRGYRTQDPAYRLLARRWARALGVLFAVGAVSGTILSFEMGLLWSGLMQHYGSVIGLPFAIEGFAFFIEAIFLGIYLYGWDRLSPRTHLLCGVPIFVAGVLSAFKAGHRIVAAVGGEQEPSIRRENDAARALEGVRCALLAADRLADAGTATTGGDAFHFSDRSVRGPDVVDDRVADLVCLDVEVSALRHHVAMRGLH